MKFISELSMDLAQKIRIDIADLKSGQEVKNSAKPWSSIHRNER